MPSETAIVATLTRGSGGRAVALRAELDALPIREAADVPYASTNEGVMHACGHDGHTAILLGAAKLLAETDSFDGTVVFIFQPAEEVVGGGKKMIEDGLLIRFPVDQVFAIHNWPGFPEGRIGIRAGPQMAAVDDFEVVFRGNGCHAAMPHLGDDPDPGGGELRHRHPAPGQPQRRSAGARRAVGHANPWRPLQQFRAGRGQGRRNLPLL